MTKYLKKIYVFLLFPIAFIACNEEISKNSLNEQQLTPSLTIEYAKDWYKTNLQSSKESNLLKVRSSDSTLLLLKPLLNWNVAELDNDSIWSVVELPWEFENGKVTMATQEVSRYCENNQSKKESILRLVILKNRKTDNIYGFKMAVVPDLEYMLSKGDELISTNYYLNRDAKLSGLVLFYSVSGQFVNGWQYKDGKVVGELNETVAKTKASSNLQKIAASFEVIEVQTCVDYMVDDGTNPTVYGTDCSSSVFTIDSSGGSSGSSGNSSTPSGGYNTNYGRGGTSSGNAVGEPSIADRTDCPESAATNAQTINNVLTDKSSPYPKTVVNANIATLRLDASLSYEYGLTIDSDGSSYWVQTDKTTGSLINTNNNSTSFNYGYNIYTYMICHTHPSSSLSSPSPLDAFTLGNAYNGGAKGIYCNVIFAADGSEYCVYVNDRTAFTNFCTNSTNASFLDKSGGSMFAAGSVYASDYTSVYNNLISQGYSQTNANSFALTAVLDKYNTGIKIAERDKPTNEFREQSITKTTKKNNYQPQRCADLQ